jgi:hypothetical protein
MPQTRILMEKGLLQDGKDRGADNDEAHEETLVVPVRDRNSFTGVRLWKWRQQ